jgi:acyl-[acyl-carrier-protein]-phospholipid O-acyltransferase/long-chain-fatty-acid--[acyl-carrier-protein] ligase
MLGRSCLNANYYSKLGQMNLTGWRILRFLMRPFVRVFYRITVIGARNLPAHGPVLLVCNHVSYVDSIILGYALERPPRFLIWRKFFDAWFTGPLVRAFGAIPVAPDDAPEAIKTSLAGVVAALKAGEVVCLFPEGGMTRTGHVHGFKRGFELIARRADVPITPVYMDGLWGSIFSFEGGRYFFKRPKRIPRPLTVAFGRPLPPDTSSADVRRAVMDLGSDAFALRKRFQLPLHVKFWRAARSSPFMWRRLCMADSTGQELTWGASLAGALMLSRWMDRRCRGQKSVGMMMPASVGAALMNAATLMSGRVPVNLNFTGARASIAVAIRRCGLKTVFTSRALLQRTGLPERPEYVYLEDVMRRMPRRDRVLCYLLAAITPNAIAERRLMRRGAMDDLATVMFTSGATGEPKGVMLSHHNIVSNIEAFSEVMAFGPSDTMMGMLPPFHSFGFTATLWTPLTVRMRVVYHPNPLDAKGVGRMVAKYRATVIAGTSSFFALYVRGCEPEQFRSLRLAVAGAQKLVPAVAEAFEARFDLPLTEGYGCTELSPVVSVNVPDVRDGPVKQIGARVGSVGRPLPGLGILVADRETLQPAAGNAPGVILVRGPSVMMRYMDDARATAAALLPGPPPLEPGLRRLDWYVTADIGAVDEDGFLHIHDRISRFSKIGGEMVPHMVIEAALAAASPEAERPFDAAQGALSMVERRSFAVVTLPDRVRGEKVVVVYSGPELDAGALLHRMSERGVPNLWLPSPKDFHRVEGLPFLPSGKLDLAATRRLAEAAAAARD